MDSFASWKMNGSGMEKEEREEMSLQGEYWEQDGSGEYTLVYEDKKETLS